MLHKTLKFICGELIIPFIVFMCIACVLIVTSLHKLISHHIIKFVVIVLLIIALIGVLEFVN